MDDPLHQNSHPDMVDENLLEMSELSQQRPKLDAPPEPEVLVETVLSHDSDDPPDTDPATATPRPRDAMERAVTTMINIALNFFVAVAICAIVMICIFLVKVGGALVLMIVVVLVTVMMSLACFLDQVMKEDENWKPVRSKIQQFKAFATAAILEEVHNFKRDWNEHLLLTDGTVTNNDDAVLRDDDNDDEPNVFVATGVDTSKKRMFRRGKAGSGGGGGGKSVVFQLVKPFLRIRKLGRRKKDKNTSTNPENASEAYVPPMV
ncbi:hypothetical protein MHU86_20423 [Fragilaria crotonensis]|nr:hypothetical protein MHU86_20423 [Fragilaria crotonensis]